MNGQFCVFQGFSAEILNWLSLGMFRKLVPRLNLWKFQIGCHWVFSGTLCQEPLKILNWLPLGILRKLVPRLNLWKFHAGSGDYNEVTEVDHGSVILQKSVWQYEIYIMFFKSLAWRFEEKPFPPFPCLCQPCQKYFPRSTHINDL